VKEHLLDAGVHFDVGPHCLFELDRLCFLSPFRSVFSAVLEELASGVSASTLEVLASGFSVILRFYFIFWGGTVPVNDEQ